MVLLGTLCYRRLSGWGPVGRMMAVLLPLLAFLGAGDLVMGLFDAPRALWNSPRLAPAFALWHGYAMYYGPESGPVLGNIYGPVMALAYLPTVFFSLPSQALTAGVALTIGYYFLPVVGLHFKREEPDYRRAVLASLGIVVFLFMTILSPPLSQVAYSIHADAPALGLSGLACFFLYARTGRHSRPTLLPAAFCAVLAVWTKQTMVPLLFALPLYLWLAEGRRVAFDCLKYLAACLVITSAVFIIWLGAQPLFFNLFVIPSHHPWYSALPDSPLKGLRTLALPVRLSVLLEAAAQWLQFCLIPLAMLLIYFLYRRCFSRSRLVAVRDWFAAQPWVLLAFVGICLLPTSLLGRVKVGGDINSLALSGYFIFVAASLVLVQVVARVSAFEFRNSAQVARLVTFSVLIGCAVPAYTESRFQINLVAYAGPTAADKAFYFLKAHPGEAYFPWNPLGHLMAEGKLYHFCYGVYDRKLADYPMSPEHLHSALPPKVKLIIFSGAADRAYTLDYLSEYSQPDFSYAKELISSSVYVRK